MILNFGNFLRPKIMLKSVFMGVVIVSFVLVICIPRDTHAAISGYERAALIAFYNSTDGDNWTDNSGWKVPPLDVDGFAMPGTENLWNGIYVDAGNTTVEGIGLYSNNLVGTIPPELGDLVNLISLHLNDNQLTGSIPPELGNLTNLDQFNLMNNQLTGSIPPELGNLTNAQTFWLADNQLTGSIPAELGNLTSVLLIYLYYNQLTGSIPSDLGNLANLQELLLNDNQLTGSIPAELGQLASLRVVNLWHNQLSGSIPAELGQLANLEELYINSNMLIGNIPTSLTNLTNLSFASIEYNALYTDDATLSTFLNSVAFGWENTQTIAPEDVSAGIPTDSSIEVSWTPIIYTAGSGGYRVFYSTTSGGPYTLFGTTADKSVSQIEVTGLNSNTTYYFVIQTRTDPHVNNQNTVDSEYSQEASTITASPSLSIDDVTINEDTGTAMFIISTSSTSTIDITVDCTTSDDTAVAGSDYVSSTGTFTIVAGTPSVSVNVPIIDDNDVEEDETFLMNLSNPINATIVDGTGVATIIDNDSTNGGGDCFITTVANSSPMEPHVMGLRDFRD